MPFFLSLFFPSIFHYLCTVNDFSIHPIQKILVANRGEIALRVMRTAKEMGIATVAVYSDADRNATFARYADEAIHIGPAPSSESYLVADKIIEAARSTGADAVHPGYGFLSENAAFAAAVEEAGIRFIGPRPHAIETMGSKLAAKETVKPFDVPLVPGTDHPVHTPEEAREVANRIGYPLLIKASAGGGGKGMRIVREDAELENSFERAVSEAVNAFGDGAVFIERFVTSPRHIEIQILADTHGNVVHLFERECSIQRRHQKVVEEAPSAVLTPELREAMGNSAIEVAKSCDYVGAGTVEFLLDDQMRYYFLEMNTRLQVEHPVTECIANVDLVREQIRIAEGHPLSFAQDDLSIRGTPLKSAYTLKMPGRASSLIRERCSATPHPRVRACGLTTAWKRAKTSRFITIPCCRNLWCTHPTATRPLTGAFAPSMNTKSPGCTQRWILVVSPLTTKRSGRENLIRTSSMPISSPIYSNEAVT